MELQYLQWLSDARHLLSQYWLYILGFTGQSVFALRFLVQWAASERKGESIIPIYFWYLSLIGGMILLVYAVFRHDPVFILAQSTGFIVYLRNLMLIYRKRVGSQKFAPSQACRQRDGLIGSARAAKDYPIRR